MGLQNVDMNEHQHLLDEAGKFCNPTTGEVVELIPEELMRRLRDAKLAIGIPGKSSLTATRAKWIVFLNTEIREQSLTQWREANRQRQRTKRAQADSRPQEPTSDIERPAKVITSRGLRSFLPPKKPDA